MVFDRAGKGKDLKESKLLPDSYVLMAYQAIRNSIIMGIAPCQ
jgi:hypothetical protein